MSVFDRAIVKAFERRSRSATTEKQMVVEVPASAQTTSKETRAVPTPLEQPAVPKNSSTAVIENVPFHTTAPNAGDLPSDAFPDSSPISQSATESPHLTTVVVPPSPTNHVSQEFPDRAIEPDVHSPLTAANRLKMHADTAPVPPNTQQGSRPDKPSIQAALADDSVSAPPSPVPELTAVRSLSSDEVVTTVAPSAAKPPSIGPPTPQAWKWPEICEQLDQFTGEGFQQLARHLQFAAEQGHKILAFVSSHRDAGRTSVLLTLTRILALEGKSSVLLIDADRRHPHIAELTGLHPQSGFDDVLQGSHRVHQATIPMSPGRVSLLPLIKPVTDGDWRKTVTTFRALLHQARRDYDMILIDAGVFGAETPLAECWLRGISDAVVTVSRQLTGQNAEHVVLDWKQIGIESLGVIETFA